MKLHYVSLTLLTIVTLAFAPNSFAQDGSPEYVVRVIYFIPNDREPDPNMDSKLDTEIKEAQDYYADQMEAHGFGRKTFRFEANDAGNVVVHHVRGKFNDAFYRIDANSWMTWEEIAEKFNMSKNIYLLVLDISEYTVTPRGDGDSLSGRALVPAQAVPVAIHELAHAFGLWHDYLRVVANRIFTNPYYRDPMTTSFCAAEWLDVNRYFNPTQEAFNNDTSIQMRTPNLAAPPADIRLQFDLTDPDGLHQAQLHINPSYGPDGIIAFQSLTGNRATVELITDELVFSDHIFLRVIDVHGNYTTRSFSVNISDLLPPPEGISIPDTNLAALVRRTLGLTPNDAITQLVVCHNYFDS